MLNFLNLIVSKVEPKYFQMLWLDIILYQSFMQYHSHPQCDLKVNDMT